MHVLLDAVAGEATDPDAQRLLVLSRLCKHFGIAPQQAVAELDLDPEHLALTLLDLDTYMACKTDFDRATKPIDDLKAWDGSPYLTLVESHTYDLRQERMAREDARRAAARADDHG